MGNLLPFVARLSMARTTSTTKLVDLSGTTGWNTVLDYDGVGCLKQLWATLSGAGTTGQMIEIVIDGSTVCLGYFSDKAAATYYPHFGIYQIPTTPANAMTTDGAWSKLNLNFRSNLTIRAYQTATSQIDVYYVLDVVSRS